MLYGLIKFLFLIFVVRYESFGEIRETQFDTQFMVKIVNSCNLAA